MKSKLKDDIALLLTAAACSVGAWIFWRYLGEHGGVILLSIVIVVLCIDNIRLRRKLRE